MPTEVDDAVNAQAGAPPATEEALDELLSRPEPAVAECLRRLGGDVLVLGASGKMGPSLCRMARRALAAAGSSARVTAVARFGDASAKAQLRGWDVETLRADLLDRRAVNALPDAANVIFMAGQKFGTADCPETAWAINTVMPSFVAERYRDSRVVVFSTGCVYSNVPVVSGGSREEDPLEPVGDYANSCVGRERVFSWFSERNGTPVAVFRLNYAIDLRYGVLADIAQRTLQGLPVDVTMGFVNVIWQGDAVSRAIRLLEHASSPSLALNVTGAETVSVRDLAECFGRAFGRPPIIAGQEAPEALLSDASRSVALFGPPSVDLETMVRWQAEWLRLGGRTLGKPTGYERFDGRY